MLENAGFSAPESVLYDPNADVYLVSNIDGDSAAKDGAGFISRVSVEGRLLALRWIDGGAEGVTLNAPKGMALYGEALWVADIDVVRVFGRRTGEVRGAVEIPGAAFLNDVAAGVSSWEAAAIFHLDTAGGASEVVSDIPGPADIGFDTKRRRVLVPRLRHDRVEAWSLAE